uniref:Uncharacterized protein n=1 Tax=Ditylenchus dipsaci TaxID=166011 RepID=A0A915EDZ4_9BILA
MMRQFRYTCQPSKSLRLDLVEFCKEYSQLCNVPNTHRLPGPGGYWRPGTTQGSTGNIGVNGNFGFGIGSVPGLEVNAGWGVGVGPLPGLENMDNIGVGLNYNLGLLGAASQPEKFRRGMDKSSDAKGGLVGVSGGWG